MSFLSNLVGGAAQGFSISGGNPYGAVAGGIIGAITGSGGGSSAVGNASNAALTASENGYLAATAAQQIGQMNFQLQQQQQANSFDDMTAEKSEMLRESNELRDVSMEQRKADTEITKEFIKSIA